MTVQEFYEWCKKRKLTDAWECARKICLEDDDGGIPASTVNDIFNVRNYRNALRDFSATEAIEEIRAHEQAQKEKEEQEEKESVTAEDVMRQYLDTFCKHNFCTKCLLHTPDFTCGRGYHFLTHSISPLFITK